MINFSQVAALFRSRTSPHIVTSLVTAGVVACAAADTLASDPFPAEGPVFRFTASETGLIPGDEPTPVPRWTNLASRSQHAEQPDAAAQPKLVKVGDSAVVRFDGEDDHLRLTGTGRTAANVTVFVVAAPHSNPGDFRGFVAANARDQRDYTSGFNIDMGPGASLAFEQVNAEGRGFGGAADLFSGRHEFGTLHVLQLTIDAAAKQVQLRVDGREEGTRELTPADVSLDELTLGARFYNNAPGAQMAQGTFRGDLAEVLIYDRALSADESSAVNAELAERHKALAELLPATLDLKPATGQLLVRAENPPPIQMLVPGFEVVELPVELTNVNNVRFRPDGKLFTVGYDGDIHLLSDTNGDGLEDHAEVFWKNSGSVRGPIGIQLTPPGYDKGDGLFVPSKGKVSLFADRDGDDIADEEIIVASGWQEIPQAVDAVGIAMDKDGSLYFGLGTANYANAYLIDEQGQAGYDLRSDRGTVQKVSADFSRRETVCTGIRFPIAFAFNQEDDLFCTEQEGATWLPNGNPFDELLHIRPGRHYGFPPRHPVHNPGVIDEPSTFDFGPQHQSTCGMVFNEPVNGGPVFGPESWHGDALICGESRGKIWRTALTKAQSGYVAGSQLIACLQMLTVDTCVAPNGDLVVACHSGPPDWGTGPAGMGKLFRIRMTQPEVPRPVATWAESANEIRIAFDRPLDPSMLRNLAAQARVEYGDSVRAGDRFETLVPPYAVVNAQLLQPRHELTVASAAIAADQQTVILNTSTMKADTHYAVTLPWAASQSETSNLQSQVRSMQPQHPQVDVDFALRGVRAEWEPGAGATAAHWSGWLPHPDLTVSRKLLTGSAGHEPLWTAIEQPGTLTLKTRVNLKDILRPAIQRGASIDYEWPFELPSLSVVSPQPIELTAEALDGSELDIGTSATGGTRWFKLTDHIKLADVTCKVATGTRQLEQWPVEWTVATNGDRQGRPIPLERFLLPWVEPGAESGATTAAPAPVAELEGGSWSRGYRVFRSETAGCARCHALHGSGPTIGPDLGNVVHRDYKSVLRDIENPSFAINPDYVASIVELHDGRVLTGVLRTEQGRLLLGDEKGGVTEVAPEDIATLVPSKTSVMPAGIVAKLSPGELKDLMTYLLTAPPHMPLESPLPAPPLRTQAEVAAVLAGSEPLPQTLRPLTIVLANGPKDHGPGEHDYPAWQVQWKELLSIADNVQVETAREFPSDEQLARADAVLVFQKGSFDTGRARQTDAFLARGGGLIYIHWAVNGNDEVQSFSERIGYASWGGRISYRHGPLALDLHNTDHPIMRNFAAVTPLSLYDESYWKLTGRPEDVTLLATSTEDGAPTPQLWVKEHNSGRVLVSIPGHYSWTFDDPLFRTLLLRGLAWTMREPIDRFNPLVTVGARMSR